MNPHLVDPHGGLIRAMKDRLAAGTLTPEPAVVAAALTEEGCLLGPKGIDALSQVICEEFLGTDPIAAYLRDPSVTDVLINGASAMWLEREGKLERVASCFPDEESVRAYAQRLAIRAGRRVDDASPFVDARLPDGTRLHAILPPLAVEGTSISLRVPRRQSYTLAELHSTGTLAGEAVELLTELVRRRISFLITGGAGTGKTTLLSTLLSLADPAERLVLIEDCTELAPDHPHVIRLEARPPNQEGRGRITVRELVRQSLRMRPSRIILGEARGGEIVDLFSALNTGHEGGCGTLHANRPQDVPARIEALGMLAGISREAVHSQAAAAVRVTLHLVRDPDGRRRLDSIAVLRRKTANGPLQAALALSFDRSGRTREWPGRELLEAEFGPARPEKPDYPRLVAEEYRNRVPWIPRPRAAADGESQ
ncbi:MAG TPA: TadA family conjugal transfer-associated ATPase [Actinospica sp.]|nr:TadA family conjugal transfer-associated ATPase [Actinospica sp.]